MAYFDTDRQAIGGETVTRFPDSNRQILGDLIAVLQPHPSGLRRWSVMRAIRENRKRSGRAIPQKLEDDVERVFRRFCADADYASTRVCAADAAPFFRPREKAGEVWALFPDRADAILETQG